MAKRITASILFAILIVIGTSKVVSTQFRADIFVIDQPVVDGAIFVARSVINEPGWIVIHADNEGEIGPAIGQAPLESGINAQIKIRLDIEDVTDTLYAMLHVDAGESGIYEFPDGPDVPYLVDDSPITSAFSASSIETTVIGTAMNADGFSTLVSAVESAGLLETLMGSGPFTIFAPSDDAFAALPEGTLDSLLADPEALSELLLYHVIQDDAMTDDFVSGSSLATIQGSPLAVTISSDDVKVNDSNVIIPDIEAFNGVLHIIDSVLIPPSAATEEAAADEATSADNEAGEESATDEAATEEAEPATSETAQTEAEADETDGQEEEVTGAGENDIVAVAAGAEEFSTLVTAINAAGLVDTLQSDGPFTVFAPTNDAFAALPEGTLDALLADQEGLINVLLYHVVAGTLLSPEITNGLSITTTQGETVFLTANEDGLAVNNTNIIIPDVAASNGVIHAIDAVLLPSGTRPTPIPEPATPTSEPTPTEVPADPTPTAAPPDPTPTVQPPTVMPVTGISTGYAGMTLPIVALVLLGLVAVAVLERRTR
ncbi:MAG: fasciclin domain-containing protein [Chloroflexota bacterium]